MADQLSKHQSKYPAAVTNHLQSLDLSIDTDGLPLFKSSILPLWPVLCSINLSIACIFPLCLATAVSKPKTPDFVNDIVQELAELMQNGFDLGRQAFTHPEMCNNAMLQQELWSSVSSSSLVTMGVTDALEWILGWLDGPYPEVGNLTLRKD